MTKRAIKISYIEDEKLFDIALDSDGDLENDDTFYTDILVSLMTDKRAVSSQVTTPNRRRGWYGDLVSPLLNYQLGSWWWLTEQARLNSDTVKNMIAYTRDALKWFTTVNYATSITVIGKMVRPENIELKVSFNIRADRVINYTITIWNNTFQLQQTS